MLAPQLLTLTNSTLARIAGQERHKVPSILDLARSHLAKINSTWASLDHRTRHKYLPLAQILKIRAPSMVLLSQVSLDPSKQTTQRSGLARQLNKPKLTKLT